MSLRYRKYFNIGVTLILLFFVCSAIHFTGKLLIVEKYFKTEYQKIKGNSFDKNTIASSKVVRIKKLPKSRIPLRYIYPIIGSNLFFTKTDFNPIKEQFIPKSATEVTNHLRSPPVVS